MLRNMRSEGHFSGGQSPSSPDRHGVASPGHGSQDRSWMSLFSAVSRPALSFVQRHLLGRAQSPALPARGAGWVRADSKQTSGYAESTCYTLPLPDTAGLMEPRGGSALHWLTADSFCKIGIQNAAEVELNISKQTQLGYFLTARSFLSHVLLSPASAQEVHQAIAEKDWLAKVARSGVGTTWWGSLWGSQDSSQSSLSSGGKWTVIGQHCPQQLAAGTKAALTTKLCVQSHSRESMPGENAGRSSHKEEPVDNGGLQTGQSDGSTPDHLPSIGTCNHLIGAGAVTASSEVALLTPDQDHGYSSLEEEYSHIGRLFVTFPAHCEEEPQQGAESMGGSATMKKDMGEETSREGEAMSVRGIEVERAEVMENVDISSSEDEDEDAPSQDGLSVVATLLTIPQCQNKAIAYIMGSPFCEGDDDSQPDRESSEDDDGFDSEGSSELSDSVDENNDDDDGPDSDSDADSETERLWNSLCQSQDRYNPRNFTAHLHTHTITAPVSSHSALVPSPAPSPLSCSPASPPQSHDVWDDSIPASEVEDEAVNLRLWRSFSSSSDPYSPLNFQAPLRTREPAEAGHGARARGKDEKPSQMPPRSPHHTAASLPRYRNEEGEERLDSGFSEPLASTVASTTSTTLGCVTGRKVHFSEEVEEFLISCDEEEDRRGPWEELARDRYRFLRRCQEVEQCIAYCLQPQHRSRIYQSYSQEY